MKVFIERVRRLKPLTASAIWPRNGRSKFGQGRANFVRWAGASLISADWIPEDANHTISPATAGDGNFNPGPDLCAGGRYISRSAGV
ncbi:hypothetical protein WN73_17390 [Bradyrhizobium sp. CCBAU 45394]|nr:hypothetical protein [Bradyrhizobium sp. CCBAU 45394]MDA9539821.1 hypothetical protein [Bradyrhizobium sp. CCBAU 21362]